MKWIVTILFVLSLSLKVCLGQISLVDSRQKYTAGESIQLCFNVAQKNTLLSVQHAFGVDIIHSSKKSDRKQCFQIPKEVSEKSGLLSYYLHNENNKLLAKGNIEITPKTDVTSTLEAYCGPKHMITGHEAFTMVTATALDPFDNPYPEQTDIDYFYSVNGEVVSSTLASRPLYSFARFYSPIKAGYGAVSVAQEATTTQEFRLSFYPHDPEDFKIQVNREHEYADAKQLVSIQTDIITDKHGNIIGDGSLAVFTIKDNNIVIAQAPSHTVDGKARVTILAPDHAVTWSISAQIANYAESNIIEVPFKADIKDFDMLQKESGIVVGPVQGYMTQRVKDGITIRLKIIGKSTSKVFDSVLKNGIATFDYKELDISPGTYQIQISIAGITKEYQNVRIQ